MDTNYRNAFSAALAEQLARRSMRQADIARSANVSPAYINKIANTTGPSPEWVDIIASATQATPEERAKLHTAAARAKGYRIP